jgi:surfeit locus 1 family protein
MGHYRHSGAERSEEPGTHEQASLVTPSRGFRARPSGPPRNDGLGSTTHRFLPLLAPGVAAFVALTVLLSLGFWQLERKAWKESLIAQIETRAHGEPGDIVPEAQWSEWRAKDDEFRRVRLTGTFLHDKEVAVHGLLSAQRGSPLQGFYIFTPLRLASGAIVIVNRGFVPSELRDPARRPETLPTSEVAVIGLVRAPDTTGWFMPDNRPERDDWFTRDLSAMTRWRALERVTPFWIDADPIPNATGWPRPGQTRLAIPYNHLGYALTWFGIALALLGVFGAWAWGRVRAQPSDKLVPPALPS